MNSIDETVYINHLLDLYGNLLTKSQQEIMKDYYNFNLSLSEISIDRKISRSAVQDAIKKATKKLLNFEKKLCLCGVFTEISNSGHKDVIDMIEEKIKNGI